MNLKIKYLLFLVLLLPFAGRAESPFAGRWTAEPAKTTFMGQPLRFMIGHGTFARQSCRPALEVPADGATHAVNGDPLTDAMSVKVLDRNRVQVRLEHRGRPVWRGTYTVAKDGRSMRLDAEDSRAALSVTASVEFERAGMPVADAHRLSGTWEPKKMLNLSAAGRVLTLRDTDNGIALDGVDGRRFDIHFDRQDYALRGYLEGATVQVGRRATNMLQVNRKQDGTLVDMTLGVVDPDGKTMTWGDMDWGCQMKTSLVMTKQPLS